MFNALTIGLEKLYTRLSSQLRSLFVGKPDAQTIKKIEQLLLEADTGVLTTTHVIDRLHTLWTQGLCDDGYKLQALLEHELITLLGPHYQPSAQVYMLVGINGSGKTTTAGKLTHYFQKQGKKVLLVAADTFRAAAVEQLKQWAVHTNTAISTGSQGSDPAAVVFQGCQTYKDGSYDILIIDTAGRLQTKDHLMKELEKIGRVIQRQLPDLRVHTLLTIDAMLGQNSREQARVFNESTKVNGIILTKVDGTGKGGIIFSISHELKIPIAYLSCGEQPDDLIPFNAQDYVARLLKK